MENPEQPTPFPSTPKASRSLPILIILIPLILIAVAVAVFLYGPNKQSLYPSQGSGYKTASGSALQTPSTNNIKPSLKSTLEIQSTSSGQIKGNLVVENKSSQPQAELYYDLFLRSPQTLGTQTTNGKTIVTTVKGPLSAYLESSSFQLQANEKKVLPISLTYSPNIKTATYQLQADIISKSGENLAVSSQNLSLSGSNKLLTINYDSCKVVTGGFKQNPGIGPNVNPGEIAGGECQVTNNSDQQINTQTSLVYGVRFIIGYPQSEKIKTDSQKITFAPHETKVVSFALPTSGVPQIYEAYASFDDETGNKLSSYTTFRWSIRGPSAYIFNALLDKNYYTQGDQAKVAGTASPSMDLFWRYINPAKPNPKEGTDLKNAQLTVSIYSGVIKCGESSMGLPSTEASNWGDFKINVPISTNCLNPEVRASILEGTTSLATFSQKVLSSTQTQTPNSTANFSSIASITTMIIAATLGLGVILLAIFILKKKGTTSQ